MAVEQRLYRRECLGTVARASGRWPCTHGRTLGAVGRGGVRKLDRLAHVVGRQDSLARVALHGQTVLVARKDASGLAVGAGGGGDKSHRDTAALGRAVIISPGAIGLDVVPSRACGAPVDLHPSVHWNDLPQQPSIAAYPLVRGTFSAPAATNFRSMHAA